MEGSGINGVEGKPVFVLKHMWYENHFVVFAVKSMKTTSGNFRNNRRSSCRTHATALDGKNVVGKPFIDKQNYEYMTLTIY
jgi:hypothetical protein